MLTVSREKKRQNNSFDLLTTLHESEQANLKPDLEPDHQFEVNLEPDVFTEEKYELFDNYQRHVHHEDDGEISQSGFKRFLCSSPIRRHEIHGKKTGSFHQCYRLDGRLIAMAVLDLLPHAVSGVYFIYHQEFEKWSFGKLSALREAALTLEGGYEYYYMGYYIHQCRKMRYKGDYKTQHVLDYDTMQWDPLDDEMRQLMDKRNWVSMSRELKIRDAIQEALATVDPYDEAQKVSIEYAITKQFYAVQYPTPMVAMDSELSLLELRMPGAMSLDSLREEVNLDEMKVKIGYKMIVHRMKVSPCATNE